MSQPWKKNVSWLSRSLKTLWWINLRLIHTKFSRLRDKFIRCITNIKLTPTIWNSPHIDAPLILFTFRKFSIKRSLGYRMTIIRRPFCNLNFSFRFLYKSSRSKLSSGRSVLTDSSLNIFNKFICWPKCSISLFDLAQMMTFIHMALSNWFMVFIAYFSVKLIKRTKTPPFWPIWKFSESPSTHMFQNHHNLKLMVCRMMFVNC